MPANEQIYKITSPDSEEIAIKLDSRYDSGTEFKIETHNN